MLIFFVRSYKRFLSLLPWSSFRNISLSCKIFWRVRKFVGRRPGFFGIRKQSVCDFTVDFLNICLFSHFGQWSLDYFGKFRCPPSCLSPYTEKKKIKNSARLLTICPTSGHKYYSSIHFICHIYTPLSILIIRAL